MPDEVTPHEHASSPSAADLPDVENLADSDDSEVIEARAKLLEAQAKLAKARTPLFDKIVLRGVIPIALAIITPWAIYKFDKATTEQEKQGQTITELQTLLTNAKKEAAARQSRSAQWRERMKKIEQDRTAELQAMSGMVERLDNTMKTALIHMTVAQLLAKTERRAVSTFSGRAPGAITPSRKEVMSNVAAQIQLPGMDREEIEEIAGETYDRVQEQQQQQEDQ
jgi:hypothetical protein